MEEREDNLHERLKQQLSELEQEWTAMKTGKSSSAVSWITVDEAIGYVDNSPRKLMLSLQAGPEKEVIPINSPFRSPIRRKLFDDSDDEFGDERKAKSFSHSSCWSSNVMRVRDDKKMKKKRGSVTMVVLLLLVLVVLITGIDHSYTDRDQIHTLVPT